MSTNENCIFCAIVAGEATAQRVYEDEQILIFMDLFPAHPGHTLIIPKHHAPSLLETSTSDLQAIIGHSKPLAEAMIRVFEADGIAVMQLNGEAAGQTVFHYHMHLIPRLDGEAFGVHGKHEADEAVLADHAAQLKAAFIPASDLGARRDTPSGEAS